MTLRPTNWAGNVEYQAREITQPRSLDQLRALVAGNERIRALGTGHSFNDLADSPDGVLVSLAQLPEAVEVDSMAATARVSAGIRYAALAPRLHRSGFGLPALASLPHISVAGACVTATHGSGVTTGVLATGVSGLELVTATGDLVAIRRGDVDFDGAVVNLGALGVVVNLTLDLVPAFEIRQYVHEGLDLEAACDHLAELFASAYSVSLFTDWRQSRLTQIWRKQRTGEPQSFRPDWFTASPATAPRHPVAGVSPESCTEQLGNPGPWYQRLPHFRPEHTPSAGHELQSEYLVSRQDAPAALRALDQVRHRIHPVSQVCEIRTVAADRLWLSPCHRRDAVGIHFTWIADPAAVLPVVSLVEAVLEPFQPRPHWAKVATIAPDALGQRYPRLHDFRELAHRFDPTGKFRNRFLHRYVF